MGETDGGSLARLVAEASHRCWVALSSLGKHDSPSTKCPVSGSREGMHWNALPGRNFFKWLVAQEHEHGRSLGAFARIESKQPPVKASKVIDSAALETVPNFFLEALENEEDEELEAKEATTPVTRQELGRATWTFLHTLAAQYPEKPTRQQQKDVRELMSILSRMYPCRECADHFKEVLKVNPVQASSGVELAQWMCRIHNVVNRSLAKPQFPCQRVDARWGALHCDEGACDLQGRTYKKP